MLSEWRTFILSVFAILVAFFGVYFKMVDSAVLVDAIYAALGAYALRTGTAKIAGAIAVKKANGSASPSPTNGG